MQQKIGSISLVVRDYDEAIAWYTEKLPFSLVDDVPMGPGKRWVTIAPPGGGAGLVLGKATTPEQEQAIGNQTGGRVFLFLHSDDFWRDYRDMKARGVTFTEEPREEPYGTVVVFKDLYGNLWDLLQLKS
ncbi:MAG: VOC family protein [Acidobacteriota bacterium]|nr:VOC family protein [Acidobacteriota bacterium]